MPVTDGVGRERLRVLITGARGFLGRSVMRQFNGTAQQVEAYTDEIRQIHSLADAYDVVCHLAGISKAKPGAEVGSLFDVNVSGTLAVMEYCRRVGARCVLASSSAVYQGRSDSGATTQDESSPTSPRSLYGISKLCAEEICRHYAVQFGVQTAVLRIFNPYGPGQGEAFLIPYVLRQLRAGEPVVLDAPESVRDFVYVEDVARAIRRAVETATGPFMVMNVGTGTGERVRDLVDRVAVQLGIAPEIRVSGSEPPMQNAAVADVRQINEVLGWRAEVTLEGGLGRMIESETSVRATGGLPGR